MGFTVTNEIVTPYDASPVAAAYVVLGDIMTRVMRSGEKYRLTSVFLVYYNKAARDAKREPIHRIVIEKNFDSYPVRPDTEAYAEIKTRYQPENILDDDDVSDPAVLISQIAAVDITKLGPSQSSLLKAALDALSAQL